MDRIDFHCHAIPPGYREFALQNGHANPDGMPALPVSGHMELLTGIDCLGLES